MLHECCKNLENLEPQPSNKPELLITKCKICDRKHYTLMAKPGILGLTVKKEI